MSAFHGIQVYEILENGNLLNGIYTNTRLSKKGSYTIDNEIARKIDKESKELIEDNKGIEGLYSCKFIETINKKISATHCNLEITKCKGVYEFEWRDQKTDARIFKGIGLMAGTTHISVSYI